MGMTGSFIAVEAETLHRIEADPGSMDELLYPDEAEDPEGILDVDKAWHAIHFILEKIGGADSVLAQAVLGGTPVGEDMEDLRIMLPEQVLAVSAGLSAVTADQVKAAYNPAEMTKADIYPEALWTGGDSQVFDYVADYLLELTEHYATAAAGGKGMVMTIS